MFKEEEIDKKFFDEILSNASDFYDDIDPNNKFNNSKKMFKDQSFLTKITMNTRMPSLNKSPTKFLTFEKYHGANIGKLERSIEHLPQIKEVISIK